MDGLPDRALLADVVVVTHLAFVGFVVFGYLAVLLGWPLGWGWIRNRLFRRLHLAAIAFVAAEATAGLVCPLTVIEYRLRGAPSQSGFVGRIVGGVLYYEFPPWVFTGAYLTLAAVAVGLYVLVPPRRPRGGGRSGVDRTYSGE